MKWIALVLFFMFVSLQGRLWVGDGSLAEVSQLSKAVKAQRQENKTIKERNDSLEAEVRDLKQGVGAVEERARSELGMIKKKNETFYQIVEEKTQR